MLLEEYVIDVNFTFALLNFIEKRKNSVRCIPHVNDVLPISHHIQKQIVIYHFTLDYRTKYFAQVLF